MPRQQTHQLDFPHRQFRTRSVVRHQAEPHRVHLPSGEGEAPVLRLPPVAAGALQDPRDPRQQDPWGRGLDDEVVRPQRESAELLRVAPLRRQEQDRHLGVPRTDLRADVVAVHPRHHHVEQHEVRPSRPEEGQRLLPVRRRAHGVVLAFKQGDESFPDGRLVLRQQNLGPRGVLFHSFAPFRWFPCGRPPPFDTGPA